MTIAEISKGAFGQFFRYGLVGGFVTILGAATYWVAAALMNIFPLVANVLAYAVAVFFGYFLHSRWSFRGHGQQRNFTRTVSRFVMTSGLSFALNSLFIWILNGILNLPVWWPILPMVFVTPLIIFVINKNWVFG